MLDQPLMGLVMTDETSGRIEAAPVTFGVMARVLLFILAVGSPIGAMVGAFYDIKGDLQQVRDRITIVEKKDADLAMTIKEMKADQIRAEKERSREYSQLKQYIILVMARLNISPGSPLPAIPGRE